MIIKCRSETFAFRNIFLCLHSNLLLFCRSRNVLLVGELLLHQGGVRHQGQQDGGVDGPGGDCNHQGDGHQGVHQRGVQERARQLPVSDQEPGEERDQEVAGRGEGDAVQGQGRGREEGGAPETGGGD